MQKKSYKPTKSYAHLTPGDRIRIACELLELSQAEIARRAGLHASHLSEIIHSRRGMGVPVAKRLSRVLHIPIARLLGMDEVEQSRQRMVTNALRRMRKHITTSRSIKENTEKILLKDVEEALKANDEL